MNGADVGFVWTWNRFLINKKIVIKMSASPCLRDIRWHVAGSAQTFASTALSYLF
jgi:hypothetical protein